MVVPSERADHDDRVHLPAFLAPHHALCDCVHVHWLLRPQVQPPICLQAQVCVARMTISRSEVPHALVITSLGIDFCTFCLDLSQENTARDDFREQACTGRYHKVIQVRHFAWAYHLWHHVEKGNNGCWGRTLMLCTERFSHMLLQISEWRLDVRQHDQEAHYGHYACPIYKYR